MFRVNKFDVLTSLYIFCLITSELMGSKTFALVSIGDFKLNASVAIFLIPIVFTINDIITEVYGKERTRSVIRSGLMTVFLILVFSILATSLPPSDRFAASEGAYDNIFGKSARIAAASLTAFAVAEFLDVFIYVRLREKLGQRGLWLRNNVSNFVAQFIDTTVFMTLAFYAFDQTLVDNTTFLTGLILPYWLLKCALSVIETPFVYLGVRWLKDSEENAVVVAS
jgi:queuosine precursor transporter